MTGFQSKRASAQDKLKEHGVQKVYVTTILRQELEVPEGWDRMDVYDFLGEYQSFRGAFQGTSNLDDTARIVDIMVLEEEVTEMGEEAFDE